MGSVGSEHIRLWPQEGGKAALLLSVSAADGAWAQDQHSNCCLTLVLVTLICIERGQARQN